MSIIINDNTNAIPVDGAIVRIDAYSISRGEDVIIERAPSTFEDVLDVDGNPTYLEPVEEGKKPVKNQI